MQSGLSTRARAYRDEQHARHRHARRVRRLLHADKNEEKPEIHGGFALSHWCGNAACETAIKDALKVTIRCVPFDISDIAPSGSGDKEADRGVASSAAKPAHAGWSSPNPTRMESPLEEIVEAIRAAAGADFAFVLTLLGRLVTERAPREMPDEGRAKLCEEGRALLQSSRVGLVSLPREARALRRRRAGRRVRRRGRGASDRSAW